jgi:hypothetical protein
MRNWSYSSTILILGTRWRWVVSFMPLPLKSQGNSPPYPGCYEDNRNVLSSPLDLSMYWLNYPCSSHPNSLIFSWKYIMVPMLISIICIWPCISFMRRANIPHSTDDPTCLSQSVLYSALGSLDFLCSVNTADVYSEKRYPSLSWSIQLNPLFYSICPQAESTHLYFKFTLAINIQSMREMIFCL